MTRLKLPPVSTRTLKKREREIAVTIEKVAETSCLDESELEQNLCTLNNSATNKEDVIHLKASSDMCWYRKGSGRTYNSKSGHVILIGTESEKILSYGT